MVVAIEDYLLLPDVDGAATTANDWETFFRNGLGVDTVRVLVNQDASREEIASFAKRAAEDVREDADLWFVFVGHGAPSDGNDGVLVGVDAQQTTSSLAARSLPQKELLDRLEKGKQARTLVVIDACFSGRSSNGSALAKGAQPVVAVEKPPIDARTVVLTAARAKEFAGSLPGAARPAFSYLLLGAMRGWADDGDGIVTADEAINWMRMRLRGIAGRMQTPQLHGEVSFTLTRGAKDTDPGVDRLLSGVKPSQTTPPQVEVPTGECSGGQVRNADTAGHCCWPGQAWNGAECVGVPSECPEGAEVDRPAEACVYPECDTGKVRARDGVNCCWPRQAWSSAKKMCIGAPACPPATVARGETCVSDQDSDGIADDEDTCPLKAEDFDNVVDDDGCPDDNDADGVPDAEDKCPDAPEDDDDFAIDGCPDPDNDEDGILDERDRCPNDAEDMDGVADSDGCPEDDFDADGIADADDVCPLQPEDVDGVADGDGCAEPGNGSLVGSYIVGGIGLGVAGLAAIPFVSASSLRASTRTAIGEGSITQAEVVDNEKRANTSATIGTIVAGVGGGLTVLGIIMWLTDADSPLRRQAEVSIAPPGDGESPRVVVKWRW